MSWQKSNILPVSLSNTAQPIYSGAFCVYTFVKYLWVSGHCCWFVVVSIFVDYTFGSCCSISDVGFISSTFGICLGLLNWDWLAFSLLCSCNRTLEVSHFHVTLEAVLLWIYWPVALGFIWLGGLLGTVPLELVVRWLQPIFVLLQWWLQLRLVLAL